MISASFPEPVCDVVAQLFALFNPDHPKDAVWLARGTFEPQINARRRPGVGFSCNGWRNDEDLRWLFLPEGTLITFNPDKARYLAFKPCDETLVDILGYIEPKSQIAGSPAIVRAVDGEGHVITEMACSVQNITGAIDALYGHGNVEITTVPDVLLRRMRLA